MSTPARFRGLSLALVLCAALGLGACSKDSDFADASGFGAGGPGGAARPGSANHADSPVSHSDTSTPLAAATAATVNA